MADVPAVAGAKVVSALERAGFKVARVSGSHRVLRHPDGRVVGFRSMPAGTWQRGRCAASARSSA